ncbi:MAG: hypothetical protein ABS41_03920 [Arenimonas sp. SCN 70-307]|uniref:hypothetical protein n=1 Tax=Arenimonas sp. SCN 70-307 TaxID=1660089 RepID=UPI000868D011|nr:hypothetical protein [Arenimonas sp. SCN 70-307]ODS63967.1 MAG: hypothetical protein ABS41_03920 [Arenimonas sp. SCN 70-307]
MKPFATLAAAVALAVSLAPAPSAANPVVEASQSCFSDNTTGKDRKLLGKWIFLALAGHPEIAGYSSATPADHEQTSRELAALFMRLVTEDCAEEMKALATIGGTEAMKLPFQHLGQIAMQELMNHKDVAGNIGAFEKYLDEAKLQAVFAPRGN